MVPHVPAPAPRSVLVTQGQLDALIAAAPPYLRLLVLLCHDCALRSGTALRLSWSHLQDNCVCIVTKRGQVARVPLSSRLLQLLEHCPRGAAPLIQLMYGRKLPARTLVFRWHQLLAACGLPHSLRPHDLRRTMAEKTYQLTGDLRVVQTLLGHSALNSTLHYLQRPAPTIEAQLAQAVSEVTGK
jgi:integrase